MADPIPCPKCGKLFVWNGARCCNKNCRFGSSEEPVPIEVKPVRPIIVHVKRRATVSLDNSDITQLLAKLKPSKVGWKSQIKKQYGTFLGTKVSIQIDTRLVPEKEQPPAINTAESELARSILLHLDDLLIESEKQFENYNAGSEAMNSPLKSHIWISREMIEEDGPNRWAFVVEVDDDSAFGWHIEFDGLKFLEIWAGD